jgi:hypothetical protein
MSAPVALPTDFAANHFASGWKAAFQRLCELERVAVGWDGGHGSPARPELTTYVRRVLRPFAAMAPAPSFSIDADGDVWALWAAHGLDLEAHFRGPDDVFVMIEDARHRLEDFSDEDPSLQRLGDALIELGNRAYAAAREPGAAGAASPSDR